MKKTVINLPELVREVIKLKNPKDYTGKKGLEAAT